MKSLKNVRTVSGLKKATSKNLVVHFDSMASIDDDRLKLFKGNTMSEDANEVSVTINDLEANVGLCESHGCCAKAYMSEFNGEPELFPALIKACELIARNGGYTTIGFIHKSNSAPVKAGKALGFKVDHSFTNKRTKNKLSEMIKML